MDDTPDTSSGRSAEPTFWADLGDALMVAGRSVGVGARAVGRSVSAAYRAVDPDLRRQVMQAPLVGLMALAPDDTGDDLADAGHETLADHRPAVLLVHGLGGHPTNFYAMQRWNAYHHGPPTYTVDLRGAPSLDAMAERLRARIHQIHDHGPAGSGRRVDIVAHSMGGIAARLALADADIRRQVATLVTMATPHGGTHLARLAATPRTLDLRPTSTICERLADQDFWDDPAGPRLVAMWSRSDTTILPPESAAWSAAKTVQMDQFTHLSYLINPSSWRQIFRYLRQPPTTDKPS